MRTFHLYRKEDTTGISGIGKVAEGVQFSSGKCALGWLTGPKGAGRSVCIYDDLSSIEAIHGHGGSTTIVYEEVK